MKKTKISMDNRTCFCSLLLIFYLGLSLIVPVAGVTKDTKKNRLNLLLITIDTLRADRVSCYSRDHINTPQMDELAKKGIIYYRAFAHNPTTLPAHTNILLGLTPLYHGVRENANFIVREEFMTLAEYLKDFGYSTGAIIGGYPLHSRFGLSQGFDVYDDDYGSEDSQKFSHIERRAEVVVQKALTWLEGKNGPWFLWMHCFDPHDPYEPPEPFKARYQEKLYDGEVAYVDYALKKLLDYMRKKNLFDNTLIVLTGDHGESLGEHGEATHGFLAYNATIWIPLIISAPGLKPARVEQIVCQIDIFPTICDILHVNKPSYLQGISLLPNMRGKKLPERFFYFESLYPYYSRGWAPLKGYIYGWEKFIESPIPELYNLDEDFSELNNLAEGKMLDAYRAQLTDVIRKLSHPESIKAEQRIDQESLEKLRSLGYISSPNISRKKSYEQKDDVKVLLPYHNKAMRALELYHEGKKYEGFELVKTIISERNDVDIAYSNLAIMYKEEGRLDEAIEVLRLGLEYLPTNYGVILNYAQFLNDSGRYDDVIDLLNINKLPQMEHDAYIWNLLGEACFKKEDFEMALKALERALSIDKKYSVAFCNLGSVYLARYFKTRDPKYLEQSIMNFRKAIELKPDYVSAYNQLAIAYKTDRRIEDAINCWKKASELRPDVGFPLLNIGLVYMDRGDKARALSYLNKYKEGFYPSLSSKDKEIIDALIQKCKRKP